jgi:predicted nucleic acid-binding protein
MVRAATSPSASARVLVCDIILPETLSALTQRLARKEMSKAEHDRAVEKVYKDLTVASPFVQIHSSDVMADSGSVVVQHKLRGADAIHLAAAIVARASMPLGSDFCFVSCDSAQIRAARVEGFPVYHPADDQRFAPA